MAAARYNDILKDLKQKIESGEYPCRSLLPSENTLTGIFKCSRNTVRRAISILVKMGYVQAIHGKGVIVIYQPRKQAVFTIGQIESFQESARKNALDSRTEVIRFDELTVDQKMSDKSGFAVGAVVFYILRVRYVNNKAVILDVNMFLKSVMPDLTPEIASRSIYNYLENELHMSIVTSKRRFTVEHITEIDEKYLNLDVNDFNCLAVVASQTYNSDGVQFEYTCSRHRPDYFSFEETATRHSDGA